MMKKYFLLMLFHLLVMLPGLVYAQKSRVSKSFLGDVIRHRGESNRFSSKSKSNGSLYRGYEISLAFPQHTLHSNLPQLNMLPMSYMGANLGLVLANDLGKIKANSGYYESQSSVPYDMNMLQVAFSGNVYPLRLTRIRSHFVEPYLVTGLAYQLTWYHGNYLSDSDNTNLQSNNGSATESLLGKTGLMQLNLGFGMEYQLVSYKIVFIHLFAEVNYGLPILMIASNTAFSGTRPIQPMMLSFGINFGVIK